MNPEGKDYTGPEFSEVWYGRNLKIFANILNSPTGKERTIFVLRGVSPTDLLRHFFGQYEGFEVVTLERVLRTD